MERWARVQALVDRCTQLGLSVEHARRLAVESRQVRHALPWVLGINPETMESVDLHRREPRRWLWMCAQSASTSYHEILAQEVLLQALATGAIPVNFIPHMCHILEEASIQSVVMAVEQAAQRSGMLPAQMRSQTKCERKRATFEFTGNTRLYTQGPVE